jgi:hypothetical protein
MSARGAKFKLIIDTMAADNTDWITLDIAPKDLSEVLKKIQACVDFEKSTPSPEGVAWSFHFLVNASHPTVTDKNGKVQKLPSLLAEFSEIIE